MAGHAFMDTNTFAVPPTQYEVTNWLFGRGKVAPTSVNYSHRDSRVRKSRPVGKGGGGDCGKDVWETRLKPRRHSNFESALETGRQETAVLKMGHAKSRSDGHDLLRRPQAAYAWENMQDGLQKGGYIDERVVVTAGHSRDSRSRRHSGHSRHSRTSSHRSGRTFSCNLQVVKGQRDSVASSAGSGDTLVGSTEDIDSSSPSPTCLRFPAGSFSKRKLHPPSPLLAFKFPSATTAPIPLPNTLSSPPYTTKSTASTSLFPPTTKTAFSHHSSHSATSSRSLASADPTMDEKSRPQKALNVSRQCSRDNEEDDLLDVREADGGNTRYRLRTQRSLAKIGRRFHLGQSAAHRNDTTQPTESSPCSSSSFHRRRPSLHSTGHSSSGNTDVLTSNNHYSQSLASQARSGSIIAGNDEQAAMDKDEKGFDPALLGSFDYHEFLSCDSNHTTASITSPSSIAQPAASTPSHNCGTRIDHSEHNSPRLANQSISPSSCGAPAPARTPAPAPTHQLAVQHNLRTKQSLPLLERRAQRLQKQFAETSSSVTPPPHQRSPEAFQSREPQSPRTAKLPRLADLYLRQNASKATHNKGGFSQLKGSLTTPDTSVTGNSSSNAFVPVLMGCSPFPGRPASQQRLPSTPRQAPAQSVLLNSPRRSVTQSHMLQKSPSPADTTMASNPLSRAHQESRTPGPAGYISYTEIDPEKLKPFIGPLTKQQPPPNKPLPHPPVARTRRFDTAQISQVKVDDPNASALTTSASFLSDAMSLSKQSAQEGKNAQNVKDKKITADQTESSIETKIRQTPAKDKRALLRKKVSTFFSEENRTVSASRAVDADESVASISTYRPISMNSLDAGDNSFSDIFDDVFKAARDSASESQRSTGPSFNSARPSLSLSSEGSVAVEHAPKASNNARTPTQLVSHGEVAERLAVRLGITNSASRKIILDTLNELSTVAPPPLTEHPAIRGDLPLQARLGMIIDSTHEVKLVGGRGRTTYREHTATLNSMHGVAPAGKPGFHILPLKLGRQRPTQVAVSTRHASRSTVDTVEPLTGFTTRSLVTVPALTKGQDDVDLSPAFDRSVDMTWYRYAKDLGRGVKESSLPYLPALFDALSTVFMVKYSRGRESKSTAYDRLRRFAYFDLEGPIRFKIMEKLLEDYLPGKPVLLNHSRQAAPAWPDEAFATLWEALGPLQNILWACPRLRADVMTALFMMQPFHVIFSPFVKPITQPLPTKWLFKYLYFMQDVRVELDMTKLGFGHVWQATGLSTRLWDIGNLVHVFVEEMLKRDPRTNPMGQLTIHCRRFFGYRQGDNPHRGDINFYKAPAGEDDEQKPGNHPAGQPWNFGRKPPSLPPSANNPYSGHRRHHAGGPDRVPFLHEHHLSVANPFQKLTGRVWSVRMVGMSEKWSMEFLNFWPKSEHDKIPKENLGLHIDRYNPSRHSYAAPGHAVFLDYGIRAGVHRFPPLPDSEPMVCTIYDDENDVFLELGSGNILTVKEDGVEIIARSNNPPIPRSDLPFRGSSPVSLDGFNVPATRNFGSIGPTISPKKQAIRKATPHKALQLLGPEAGGDGFAVTSSASPTLQGDGDDNDDADDDDKNLVTPITSRMSGNVMHSSQRQIRQISMQEAASEYQLSQMRSNRRCPSLITNSKPMSSNNLGLGLKSAERRISST